MIGEARRIGVVYRWCELVDDRISVIGQEVRYGYRQAIVGFLRQPRVDFRFPSRTT
ncbi:MAG: hypothetical protein HYZ89_01625 [Candidatus Omnitrophica bacterium]|nr:hypothetical protein [Candidatus Omnitrophota bacterium]